MTEQRPIEPSTQEGSIIPEMTAEDLVAKLEEGHIRLKEQLEDMEEGRGRPSQRFLNETEFTT